MGIFDSLQLKKRLESMASDAGKSIVSAVTPKSPVPLSIAGLQDVAGKAAGAKLVEGESKAGSKVKDLEKATVGKVGSAVQTRIDNTAYAVESKVNGKLAEAEGKVDAKIAKVGSKVDEGIDAVNGEIDKAGAKAGKLISGKPKKPAPAAAAPAPAAADSADTADTAAEEKDTAPVVIGSGRKRSNAVTERPAAVEAEPAEAQAEAAEPAEAEAVEAKATETESVPEAAEPVAAAETAKPAEVKPAEADAAEAKTDTEPEAEVAEPEAEVAEPDTDLDGLAADAAEDRKQDASTTNEAEVTEEQADEFDEAEEVVGDEAAEIEQKAGDDLDEAELDKLTADNAADGDEVAGKRRELKKNLRKIDNELAHTLGGGLATAKTSGSKDPWVSYFIAVSKFKKKIAVRDFNDDLAGKKKDKPEVAVAEGEVAEVKDEEATAEDEPGREDADKTEVEIKGGLLYRSLKSPMAGDPADTTDTEIASPDGRQIFVADKTNKIFLAYRPIAKDDHTQLLGRDDIAVGGEMRIEQGKIDFLSNDQRGDTESLEAMVTLLRALRDNGVAMDFDVYEASKKDETTAEKLLAEAEAAEPEPQESSLLDAMKKNDAWKTIVADFSEEAILAVIEKEKWKVTGDEIVDTTGSAVDPEYAREQLKKHVSKQLMAEVMARKAAKTASAAAAAAGA